MCGSVDGMQAQIIVAQLQRTNQKLPYAMEPAQIAESVAFATAMSKL